MNKSRLERYILRSDSYLSIVIRSDKKINASSFFFFFFALFRSQFLDRKLNCTRQVLKFKDSNTR